METPKICQITFQMKFQTSPTESVRIIGNLNELGFWDPGRGLVLISQEDDSTIWISPEPLRVEKNTKLEFKCVVMEGEIVKRWENFPNDSNRKYKAKYAKTTLKGSENNNQGKEFINEKGQDEENNSDSKKKPEQKNKIENFSKKTEISNSQGSDLAISESAEVKRPELKSLNPLDGDADSEDSNSSILGNNNEGTPQNKKRFNDKVQEMHANLEEILSVQSDSFELEKKKNVFNFNDQRSLVKGGVIGFSEIFKQLREKHFKKKMTSMHHLMIKDISLEFQLANTNIIPVPMTQKFSEKFSNDKDPMIVLCKFLPIKLIRSELGIYTAEIIKDSNQFYLSRHLLNGNYKKVLCIGMLRHYVDESCRVEITRLLRKTFNCIPIFLNYDVKEMFLTSHEIFSMLDSLILSNYSTSLSIDKVWGSTHSAWEVLREINKNYCQILNEFKNSEYETLLISDYHLILTPKLLIQQGFKLTIGYYFNANFPTFEVFRLFPFKDEFLEGLLQCDLIYFNCFEQARPFFLAMFLEKNIDLLSKSGLLYFTYKDKPTFIKLKSVTVDSKAIHSLKKIPIPAIKTLESDKYNIILGMDRVSELTGIEQKMRLIVQWVQETNNEYNIKLIQILQKPYYGGLTEKQKIWLDHIRKTEKELNSKFAEPIIELWEIDPNEEESLYLMSKVRILLNTSIKNEYCIDSMKFVLATERFGNVLISEFLNYNKSCSSIFSFNPLKYIDFKQKIENLLKTPLAFSKELNQSDVFYLLKYPVESWFSEIFADLKSINISKPSVIPPQKILYNPSLPFFEMDQFQQDYHKSKNRIFIFEFFGVLARSTPITDLNRFSKKSVRKAYQLNENLMKALNILIQDEKNTVYVITSKSASNLDIALGNIPNIGLAAESGYLYKLKGKNKWSKLVNLDWSWKEVVKKNMENYTKNTLGSTLEIKESALVWHYDDVPLELAEMQSKSLIKHLKSSLEKIKEVDIFLERKYIEARPVGISKATFVTLLLKSCQMIDNVDFIMVIGEDRGMFGKVREFIKENSLTGREDLIKRYLIWVGEHRREGDYLLNDSDEVGDLIEKISDIILSQKCIN